MLRRRMLQVLAGAALLILLTIATSLPARADNCGSLSDCFGTTGAAIAALVAVAILAGILAVALPALLAAVAEAAAIEAAEAAALAEAEAAEAAAAEAEAAAAEAAATEAEATAAEASEAAEGSQSAEAESNFADEEKLADHYEKHGDEFGDISQEQYLQDARELTDGGDGINQFTRPNGDTMYYNPTTNEFGVKTADGIIRTYFKPSGGLDYWVQQVTKFGGTP